FGFEEAAMRAVNQVDSVKNLAVDNFLVYGSVPNPRREVVGADHSELRPPRPLAERGHLVRPLEPNFVRDCLPLGTWTGSFAGADERRFWFSEEKDHPTFKEGGTDPP